MLRKPQDISKVQYYKNMVSPLHPVSPPTKFDALDGQTNRGIVFLLINYTKNYSFLNINSTFLCVCVLCFFVWMEFRVRVDLICRGHLY